MTEDYEDRYEDSMPDSVEQSLPEEEEHDSPVESYTAHDNEHSAAYDNKHDEFEEEHPSPRNANRPSGKKRIGQLTREKYQLLDALRQANEEKEALRQQSLYLNSSLGNTQNAALTQHQHSIALKAENAKKAKIKAYEEGDIEAQVRADELLAEAKAEELQANMWKIQNDADLKREQENWHRQQQYAQQQQQIFNQPHIDENLFHDWVEDNEWFHPQSRNYNPQAQARIIDYAKQVDEYLIRMGRPDKILSPEYFEELDAFARKEGYHAHNNRRQLEMRNRAHDVAPVSRGGYGTTNRNVSDGREIRLSQEDKETARSFGLSEKEYAKYKLDDIKKQKQMGRPY